MSAVVFLAVLGAALLHAGWNGLIRVGAAKVTTMLIMTLVQGGIGLCLGLYFGLPAVEAAACGWAPTRCIPVSTLR